MKINNILKLIQKFILRFEIDLQESLGLIKSCWNGLAMSAHDIHTLSLLVALRSML
jgi:hypothetical protein